MVITCLHLFLDITIWVTKNEAFYSNFSFLYVPDFFLLTV
jgi:hypothetical protein